MPTPRSLSEVLAAHGVALKNDIRKAIPATVTAVHLDRQTVDLQVAINNPLNDDLGNIITEPAPSISDVPWGVVRGGGFMVWVPPTVGDSALLIFSDLSADTWRAGNGTPQDPGFVGKHTLDSPFAVPMFAPDASMFADPAATSAAGKVIIGKDGSAAQIRISATDIELGNNATAALALSTLIDSFITAVNSWTPVPNDGGAALKAKLAAWVTSTGWGTTVTTTGSAVAKSQ